MAQIKVVSKPKQETILAPVRKPAHEILKIADAGPSPTGSTFYKSMLRCPREHALSQKVKLRTVRDKEALTVGWLFHLVMEVYNRELFRGTSKTDAEEIAMASFSALKDQEGYADTYETVLRVAGAYFDTYRVRDNYKVLAIEETLVYKSEFYDASLKEQLPLQYSARLDLFVEVDGYSWVMEHKTARAITEDLVSSYQLDLQILGQVWLLKNCVDFSQYPKFGGVIVNIATKSQTPKFERVKVNPSDAHLQMFEDNMKSWTKLRRQYEKNNWPQALGSCSGFARGYTTCEFFKLCHGYPERSVEDWQRAKELPDGFTCGGKVSAVDE